jgi:XrtJ-associated TM-motif-TM protein
VLLKTTRNIKFGLSTLVLLAAFAAGSSARAQSGGVDNCNNSPENPTAILALVGSAGGALVALRSRFRRKP